MPPGVQIGALGSGAAGRVDAHGALHARGVELDWWVGADDRWHVPEHESTTRQHRLNPAPVIETIVRIPGGDAAHRAYGASTDRGAVIVVELENRSPAPFTAALVVRVSAAESIALDGTTLRTGGGAVVSFPRPPGAWADGPDARATVMNGGASRGPFEPAPGAREIALLFPVAHRTTWRLALAGDAVDVRSLPGAEAVARGWDTHLERGMQAALPPPIGDVVDAARADLLLTARTADVVAALEDWGFDAEAADGWAHLRLRERRRARTRRAIADPWPAAVATDARTDPARFLTNLRAVLVGEPRGGIDLLPGFPPDWLGQSITVDAVPLHAGRLSFAVRWHGPRPALLWDAPEGIELRAPALDPGWSSTSAAGDALLAAPPRPLLAMGGRDRSAGTSVAAPGQFS